MQRLTLTLFFAGICAGGASLVAPIYVAEISEKSRRGLFGSRYFLKCDETRCHQRPKIMIKLLVSN